MICGVDEAGKGSVLGPMVIAAVGADAAGALSDLPVKDSKLLSPKQRGKLYKEITARCRVATVIIAADRIDSHRLEITMNECVARAHASAIGKIRPVTAYVDACDVNADRYARMVQEHLKRPCRIIAEHRADQTYPIVSAASIVAKVVRDREVASLKKEYGAIGSGYPSDPETISFLSSYIEKHRHPPACARRSWKTVGTLLARQDQTTLPDFS